MQSVINMQQNILGYHKTEEDAGTQRWAEIGWVKLYIDF